MASRLVSVDAVSCEPDSKGGAGSYSMASWRVLATWLPGHLGHQPECHVDPGRDSGGGDDLALADVTFGYVGGAVLVEPGARVPVGGGFESLQDAGGAEDQGSGADRGCPAGVLVGVLDPLQQCGVVGRVERSL